MDKEKIEERIDGIIFLMEPVMEDNRVPRNIRHALSEAKGKLQQETGDLDVNIASAIYLLDEISNDINMPSHTRMDIWSIISELEKFKEDLK